MAPASDCRTGDEPRAGEHRTSRRCTVSEILHRPEAQEELKRKLAQRASELAGCGESAVDLLEVCRELRVGLSITRRDGDRRGALVKRGKNWEVLLMRDNPKSGQIAAHERFTIAHELGHLVLLQESEFRPKRRAEYWLGEKLCHHFASRLLIRSSILDEVGEPEGAACLMTAVNRVAQRAQVTAEPAARAIVERIERPIALGTFLLDPLASTKRLGFRGWWAENRHWWAERGGRRLAVYRDHPLSPVLTAMTAIVPGQMASPALTGAQETALRRRTARTASFAALLI